MGKPDQRHWEAVSSADQVRSCLKSETHILVLWCLVKTINKNKQAPNVGCSFKDPLTFLQEFQCEFKICSLFSEFLNWKLSCLSARDYSMPLYLEKYQKKMLFGPCVVFFFNCLFKYLYFKNFLNFSPLMLLSFWILKNW